MAQRQSYMMTTTATETWDRASSRTTDTLWRLLAFSWLLLVILSWVLIIAGMGLPRLVQGTHPTTNSKFNIGLFRQCVDTSNDGVECETHFPTSGVWQAAVVMLIIGLFLLSMSIIIIFLTLNGRFNLVLWAKILMVFANLFLLIGFILVPIGFAWLDDNCKSGFQCGLVCTGTNEKMSFFSLCYPWGMGEASWILFAGMLILFIGSFCSIPLSYSYPAGISTANVKKEQFLGFN